MYHADDNIQDCQSMYRRHRTVGLAVHDVQMETTRRTERRWIPKSEVFHCSVQSASGRRFPRLLLRRENRPLEIRLHHSHGPHLLRRPLLFRANARLRCGVFRSQLLLPPGGTASLNRGFLVFRSFLYVYAARQPFYIDPPCGLQPVLYGKPVHQWCRGQ